MAGDVRAKEPTKYRVDIYIGSDNDSRKIHDSYLDKVRKWASARAWFWFAASLIIQRTVE